MGAGFHAFVSKPIAIKEFTDVIAQLLAGTYKGE